MLVSECSSLPSPGRRVPTRFLRKTAMETKAPSWTSLCGVRCQLSQSLITRVTGTANGRPRARDMLLRSDELHVNTGLGRRDTYPRSRTNKEIQHRSLLRSSSFPVSDHGSTSGKPSMASAIRVSRHSPRARVSSEPCCSSSVGTKTLWRDRSMAILVAMEMYTHASSSVLCRPGNIHGMLIIKARTISTDLCRRSMTLCASVLTWLDNRLDKAAAEGMNSAEAAMTDVQRKAERVRVNETLWILGSRPHRVCARFA